MNTHDFKALWDWCNQCRNNDEFWRRFLIATAAYDAQTQGRLVRFANALWFGVEEV